MPIACPVEGCDYETTADATDAALIVQLLKMHESASHGNQSSAKVEKVRRPSISAGGTHEEWVYFNTRWTDYVTATKVVGQDRVVQLLECCDETLRKDLTRLAGGTLLAKDMADVLKIMKTLAVRQENVMVSRFSLHNMTQDQDEPIRAFGARVKGQALVCDFSIKCDGCQAQVDYTDEVLRDVLSRGINDTEIQLDLLGDQKQDMSLEEMFKFVEAKESGKRSASRLAQAHNMAAARSSYSRGKKESMVKRQVDDLDKEINHPCSYCGKRGHGAKAPPNVRKKSCLAFGKSCKKCSRLNHFEAQCHSSNGSVNCGEWCHFYKFMWHECSRGPVEV